MITFSEMVNDIKVKVINNFDLIIKEGFQTGIYFRSPLCEVDISYFDPDTKDPTLYLKECNISLYKRLIEYIKGNYHIINKVLPRYLADINDIDVSARGVGVNIFISPIYFKREFRELICETKTPKLSNIQSIYSFGYKYFDDISGTNDYSKETTYFSFINYMNDYKTTNNEFQWTYEFIIENLLNNIYK